MPPVNKRGVSFTSSSKAMTRLFNIGPDRKFSATVRRKDGDAAGKITLYSATVLDGDQKKIDSKSWGDSEVTITSDEKADFPFLFIEAEFTSGEGRVEVEITN